MISANQSTKSSSGFLLVSACLLLLLSFGYRSGFGLFMKPLSDAHDWGRQVMSMALAIQNLTWGVVAVIAGGLADRFGNVKVIVGGTLFYGAGMALMSWSGSPWQLNSTAGFLVGAGVAGTSFGIVLPAMARAVPEHRRQWALGVGTAAGSMGQFVVVPVAQLLIASHGWVTSLHLLAGSAMMMALLALPLARYSGADEVMRQGRDQTVKQALLEALRHPSFLLLTSGFFVCGFHIAFITAHLPAFLSDAGFKAEVGAWSIAIIGLCNVVGAYSSGMLSGRLPKRHVLVFIYGARAITVLVFLLIPISLVSVLVFSAAMGFLWLATVPPTSGLVATMFGTRYMALLYGIVFLGHQVGSFCGVWLGGWAYDTAGSYDLVWWLSVFFSVFAMLLHWPIRERKVGQLVIADV